MCPESVPYATAGQTLTSWHWGPLYDQRDINRVLARRFQRGSYRPSDRAALLLDCAPELTPYAPDVLAAD